MHRSQRLLKYGGQVSSRHRQGATGCMCHGGGGEACSAVEEGMKASMTNVVIKKIRRTGRRDGRAARHACFANIREAVLPFRLNSFQTRPAASERAVQTFSKKMLRDREIRHLVKTLIMLADVEAGSHTETWARRSMQPCLLRACGCDGQNEMKR